MKHPAFPAGVTRATLLRWFREGRQRTKEIFAIPVREAYFERPIALRNPIVFYEGHLPAFCINTLIKLALGQEGIDERLEVLFARGIDPDSEDGVKDPGSVWPSREAMQAYGTTADSMIEHVLRDETIEDEHVPQLRGAESAFAILEHEQMHQETFLYMLHNLPYERKVARPPLGGPAPTVSSSGGRNESIAIPAGQATLGADREELGFGWDNEFPRRRVDVDPFSIDKHSVTNGDWLAFMDATGAAAPHFWRRLDGEWLLVGMFALQPLPLDAPVYVMHDEANAYARWRGRRLPTEAEYHRAAYGSPSGEERQYPWGNAAPDATRGNFGFAGWDPVPVGSYPDGASAWGVHDLVGNGWEWTSTIFDGFPGFEPMASYPVYSNDFFDGQHYVMKGASPVTAHELIRPSFRNWFRPNYPYVYAKFRLVAPHPGTRASDGVAGERPHSMRYRARFLHPVVPMETKVYKPTTFNLSGLTGISDKTLEMHFKLYEGYVTNTNGLTERISAILADGQVDKEEMPAYSELTRRLGFEYNGMVLHEYYFGNMKSQGGDDAPKGSRFRSAVEKSFPSYEIWKTDFVSVGKMRGVGWAIAYLDPTTGLVSNHWVELHENGNVAGFAPLLVMDVWEHAYLLDYKPADRPKYIEAFLANVDWSSVEKRVEAVSITNAAR